MVREEARALEFPDPNLLVQLEHIILSHHGSLEFGSPVLPKTREALLVYFLDDLDAKLKMMGSTWRATPGTGNLPVITGPCSAASIKGATASPWAGPGKDEEK